MRKRNRDARQLLKEGPRTKIAHQQKQDAVMSRWLRTTLQGTIAGSVVGLALFPETAESSDSPITSHTTHPTHMANTSQTPVSPQHDTSPGTTTTTTTTTTVTTSSTYTIPPSIAPPLSPTTLVASAQPLPTPQLTFHLAPSFSFSVLPSTSPVLLSSPSSSPSTHLSQVSI